MTNGSFVRPFTVVSTDVADSSAGGYLRHEDLGDAAQGAIRAAARAWPDPAKWVSRDNGDGETTLAPSEVAKSWLLTEFINRTHVELQQYNRNKAVDHRVRLRVGIDFGDVRVQRLANGGLRPSGGDALVTAARLRDCEPANELMRERFELIMVVVISDRMFQEAVVPGDRGLRPESFQELTATVSGKPGYQASAWMTIPGSSSSVLMPSGVTPIRDRAISTVTGTSPPLLHPNGFTGVKADHIHGGVQAGVINGGVKQTNDSPKPRSSGAPDDRWILLRSAINVEGLHGELDEETVEAAMSEIDLVEFRRRADDPKDTKTAIIALQRLRGLVVDFPHLLKLVNREIDELRESS